MSGMGDDYSINTGVFSGEKYRTVSIFLLLKRVNVAPGPAEFWEKFDVVDSAENPSRDIGSMINHNKKVIEAKKRLEK